jgi:murein DD-endopeptidase MepM/ murein hydrolase activator NlpD
LDPGGNTLRLKAATFGLIAMLTFLVACGGDDSPGDGSVIISTIPPSEPVATATLPPAGTIAASPPASTTSPALTATTAPNNGAAVLSGFSYPITGGCLPQGDQLMPNAPREYRKGVHEGIDFYNVDNCTAIGVGTPVHAAKAGRVIRVDRSYVDLNSTSLAAVMANPTTAESIDVFRGRQVWVDHGGGVVTRYCHLSAVADGLQVGSMVNAGDVIAFVGESGTPESVGNPGHEYHLHFEVRVGDSYLGSGQPAAQVRALYTALFRP